MFSRKRTSQLAYEGILTGGIRDAIVQIGLERYFGRVEANKVLLND